MKVKEVEKTEEEVSYKLTLEISEHELRYILHRLNMGENKFREEYNNLRFNKLCDQVNGFDLYSELSEVLDGDIDD